MYCKEDGIVAIWRLSKSKGSLKTKAGVCVKPSPFISLLQGLDKETCLIPAVQEPVFPQSYNLVTENLALTEYTLYLGFHR